MRKKTTIYLSSTFDDLVEHRKTVRDALDKAGYHVLAMESYVAEDAIPVDKCKADVEVADIFVGLIAFRYGFVPPPQHDNPDGLSITELEYRHATAKQKPRLMFILHEDAPLQLKYVDACREDAAGPLASQNIRRFRRHLWDERLASDFKEPAELANKVQAAITQHLAKALVADVGTAPAASAPVWDIATQGSPFPGLLHFSRHHASVMFGREPEVQAVLERIRAGERFMIISGDSGTGKSSLVDAGVLSRLDAPDLPPGLRCDAVRVVPGQGAHPFEALAQAVHGQLPTARVNAPIKLGARWREDPRAMIAWLKQQGDPTTRRAPLVLFLDQMEELFTGRPTLQERQLSDLFLSALHEAACVDRSVRVIATVRADCLHHCFRHPKLLEIGRSPGHFPLGHLEAYKMRDVIALPTRCAGLEMADTLVGRLICDAGSDPGSLPLLAFALERLFLARDGNALTEQAYEAIGGVAGAISSQIAEVEQELREECADRQGDLVACLNRIFPRLVRVDTDGLASRRREQRDRFGEADLAIVDRLVQSRLLSTEGSGADCVVSVAHERLFGVWPALSGWIADNQEDLRVLRHAEIEAAIWESRDHEIAYLWHADRLKRLQLSLTRQRHAMVSDAVRRFAQPQAALVSRLDVDTLGHAERAAIGTCLSALGDPRPGVGVQADGAPEIDWVAIAAGRVVLAEDAGTFEVDAFEIARFPITNVQFQAFVDAADGYDNDLWWQELNRRVLQPRRPTWPQDNLPRDNVAWYEAVAFCRWISARLGFEVRLPTEWEWQLAAGGDGTGRAYPWGDEWDPNRCNCENSGLLRTVPVGLYPGGCSPQGVADLAGNLFEWCLNSHGGAKDVDTAGAAQRSKRGGSWGSYPASVRADKRSTGSPALQEPPNGFRVCRAGRKEASDSIDLENSAAR